MINVKMKIPKTKELKDQEKEYKEEEEEEEEEEAEKDREETEKDKERMSLINLTGFHEALKVRFGYFEGFKNRILERFEKREGKIKIELKNRDLKPQAGLGELSKFGVKNITKKNSSNTSIHFEEIKNKKTQEKERSHKICKF